MKINTKYEAAISDTDILIDLFRTNTMEILKLLFKKIVIPSYIYNRELPKTARKFKDHTLSEILSYIEYNKDFFCIVSDDDLTVEERILKKQVINKIDVIAGSR